MINLFAIVGVFSVLYVCLRVGFGIIDMILEKEAAIKEYEAADRGDNID